MCGKDLTKYFLPPRWCCEARVDLFKCQRKSIKQFSPLRRPREVGTSLFLCGKNLKSRFKLPGGAVKHVQACLSATEIEKTVFTTVVVLWGSRKTVYARESPTF